MRRAVLASVGIVLVAVAPRAQVPAPAEPVPSTKGLVLKGRAPVSDEILRVRLPRPAEADLPNGLHLMVLEDRHTPLVFLQMVVPGAGGYFDPPDLPGLASFTAGMTREGTTTRSSREISEELERLAASVNVSAGLSSPSATLTASSLTEHFEATLRIAADVLLNPTFPPEEVERFRQRTRGQLVQQRANPGFLAMERFNRALFGDHPAGRVAPSLEALDRLTPARLAEFHKARYAPDHAILAIAGDISMAEARRLVERVFGGWARRGIPEPAVTDPPTPEGARVSLVARPGSVQTNLVVGVQAIRRTDPDYEALTVMNRIIGGGPAGRLFLHLREQKGYTYGAYSSFSAGRYRGAWQASTSVRTEVTEPALRDLLAEIARLRDEPVPAAELQTAKRAMVAAFALSLEDPSEVLDYYVTSRLYRLPADYWDRYPERLMQVTAADVQAAARKYLDAGRLRIVAVGDADKVREILAQQGALEVYDADGRRVSE
jgi:zinc protease